MSADEMPEGQEPAQAEVMSEEKLRVWMRLTEIMVDEGMLDEDQIPDPATLGRMQLTEFESLYITGLIWKIEREWKIDFKSQTQRLRIMQWDFQEGVEGASQPTVNHLVDMLIEVVVLPPREGTPGAV